MDVAPFPICQACHQHNDTVQGRPLDVGSIIILIYCDQCWRDLLDIMDEASEIYDTYKESQSIFDQCNDILQEYKG